MIDKEAFALKIGVRLKKIRTDKGISQAELGLLGDFDKHALSRIENGLKQITVHSLQKICTSLDITLEEFFKDFDKQ